MIEKRRQMSMSDSRILNTAARFASPFLTPEGSHPVRHILGWFERILRAEKVEVKKNPHPFFRLFWYWLGANFIYILPILLYGSIKSAWYFLDGMERFQWITLLVIELWSVATFFSLLIMSVTGAIEWVFQSLGHSDSVEENAQNEALEESEPLVEATTKLEEIAVLNKGKEAVVEKAISAEEVKMADKESDDDKANNA
ncbi:cobalamin biosynthesis protein [Lasius niger]|uniref:Cobalamin biosynthesis protein n=1 Tax=Lasius niger TaxID=67767 RepID=A0A0J7JX60_LASNI|nr:cobalamin biosynthesis protein [Lasius niger]